MTQFVHTQQLVSSSRTVLEYTKVVQPMEKTHIYQQQKKSVFQQIEVLLELFY